MSEDSNETTVTESPAIPAGVLARKIAAALNEPNLLLIHRIISAIGTERTQTFLRETLDLEAQGGVMTRKGDRKRTPGGVFFYIVRQAVTRQEERKIWPPVRKKAAARSEGVATPAAPKPAALTWEQVLELVQQAKAQPGEAKTVKITLIGRPLKLIQQAECVILSMKGKEPASLPKGLPTPPAGSTITWAVFIANKQWEKVKETIKANEEDQLILEGYPLIDPKSQASVVLVTSCKSVLQERAQRETKKKV